jgi:hypothetical protein
MTVDQARAIAELADRLYGACLYERCLALGGHPKAIARQTLQREKMEAEFRDLVASTRTRGLDGQERE